MQNNEIEIGVAEEKDAKELTSLYRKLYAGDEEQKFFESEADPSYFNSDSWVFVARSQGKILDLRALFSTSTSKTKVLV